MTDPAELISTKRANNMVATTAFLDGS